MNQDSIEQEVKVKAKSKIQKLNANKKVYEDLIGKKVTLGSSVFWSNGSISLSALSTDEKQQPDMIIEIREDMDEKDLMDIYRGIRTGTLKIVKNPSQVTFENIQLNDENIIKEYSTYDDILSSVNNRSSFIKKMEEISKTKKIDIKFLEKLKQEELSGEKRKDIIEEIENMINGFVKT